MQSDDPVGLVRIAGHPILHILVSFPIACFTGALATDIAYSQTANMLWADFSAWLLAAAMVFGVLAAIAGIGSAIARRRVITRRPVGVVVLGSLIVLALGLANNLVHSRDGWTAVMPEGLVLSAVTVLVMLATAWVGFGAGYVIPLTAPYGGARV